MGSWCSLRHVSTTSGQVYTSEATVSHVSPAASNPSHRTRNSTWCVVGLWRWEVNRCTKLSGKRPEGAPETGLAANMLDSTRLCNGTTASRCKALGPLHFQSLRSVRGYPMPGWQPTGRDSL